MAGIESDARSIFLLALERPPEQWPAFLDGACEGDAELRERIERLLHAHQAQGPIPGIGVPCGDLPAGTFARPPISEGPGTVIGPYKLLEQIGEGGFGVVFLAEQQQPVRRQVALKVLKPGMDTRQVVARFEAERQALALMDHPNIAKVLDAGTTEEIRNVECGMRREDDAITPVPHSAIRAPHSLGRPYFVMELVKGVLITTYCDECRVSVRQRLDLFLSVCEAVQHAHQKGIIHRDLKPSNVLIAMQEGRPVVKVIDFGIAKAMNQRLTEQTFATGFAQILGTPLYMSPEQAELSPLEVDTRSDIYSLGVLLYELLTGATPFEKERLSQASFDELRRIIREEEPPRPSRRLSTLQAEALSTVAERRRTDAKRLHQLLSGDLDWIVMKALEKDRTRRYETASAFAADVRRYLADEPVLARPPSAAYRFRKFARRNRGALLAAVLLLLAVAGGTIGAAWQATRATRAEHQAREAQRQAHRAVNDYFTAVSEQELLLEPSLLPLRRKLLEAAVGYYREFVRAERHNPELQAELAATCFRIAILTYESGSEEDWLPWFEEGVDIVEDLRRRNQDLSSHPSFRVGQRWLGIGLSLPVRDRDKTLHTLERAAAIWEDLARREPTVPGFRNDLAAFYLGIGALNDHFAIGGLHERARQEKAGAYYSKAVELYRGLTRAYPRVSQYRAGLAMGSGCNGALLIRRRRTEDAERAMRQALEAANELVADFPDTPGWRDLRGLRYQELGLVLEHLRRLGEAETAYRDMLAQYDALRSEYPTVVSYAVDAYWARVRLGEVLWETNRRQEATELFRQAVAIADESDSTDPAKQDYFAWLYVFSPDPQFCSPERAIKLAGSAVEQSPLMGDYWMILGAARYRAGEYEAAVGDLQRSLELPFNYHSSPAHFFLAMAYWRLDRKEEALDAYQAGVEQLENRDYIFLELRRLRAEAAELLSVETTGLPISSQSSEPTSAPPYEASGTDP